MKQSVAPVKGFRNPARYLDKIKVRKPMVLTAERKG